MTATDAVARHDQAPAATVQLPPFSGSDAVCPKCLYSDAFTRYRQATHRTTAADWNGTVGYRGPLPERLERECERCSYTWEEALVADVDGMSVDALAHALHNATPHPVELDPDVRKHTARELLTMLRISARPEHPLWQYSDGTPTPPRAVPVCEVDHPTRDAEDACERRRTGQPAATVEEISR